MCVRLHHCLLRKAYAVPWAANRFVGSETPKHNAFHQFWNFKFYYEHFPRRNSNFLVLTWVLLNRAPTSIHLHPAPPTSTQLILTFTLLHLPPPSSFQLPPSSLHHPQQYLNQNIACNWEISTNLGRKSKSCPLAHMVYWRCWFGIQT